MAIFGQNRFLRSCSGQLLLLNRPGIQIESSAEPGAQIDLLIDRADNCINLCEIKYRPDEMTLSNRDIAAINRPL